MLSIRYFSQIIGRFLLEGLYKFKKHYDQFFFPNHFLLAFWLHLFNIDLCFRTVAIQILMTLIVLSGFALLSATLFYSASCHVYVRVWKTDSYAGWRAGQKEWKLSNTAYRPASENIGWVGSNFLTTNKAIVCSASHTPKGTIAPSGGQFFSDAAYSAGKTLQVKAGGKVTMVLEAGKGRGYPHYHGHILAYLGKCGDSPTACQSFDASTASYFKIQEVKDGVQQLRKQYSRQLGGDIWVVDIPQWVPQASYIFRFEIVTWGESVTSEGYQDQYYPSCGQLYIQSNNRENLQLNSYLRLPGGYPNGNMKTLAVPGPSVASPQYRKRNTSLSRKPPKIRSNNPLAD